MKSKIFISHAGKDRAVALQLSSLLHERGAETWTDADVPPGENWANSLRKMLQQANVVLLLISKNYKKSDNSLFELGAAIGLDKKILSVAMSQNVGDMHGIFEKSQVVNGKKLGRDKLVDVVMAAAGDISGK
ncbi:MAG: toll/interleukin-1 receptor domain-containing protein [Saprospiraceae bacterium]